MDQRIKETLKMTDKKLTIWLMVTLLVLSMVFAVNALDDWESDSDDEFDC